MDEEKLCKEELKGKVVIVFFFWFLYYRLGKILINI